LCEGGRKMILHILSEGDYSDYRVLAVYDDGHLDEAKRVAELVGADLDCRGGPFELNKFDVESPPDGMKYFSLCVGKDGTCIYCREEPVLDVDGNRLKSTWYASATTLWKLHVHLYAVDDDHARKIVSDLRHEIIAGAKPDHGEFQG
jgi:hypothetical protein